MRQDGLLFCCCLLLDQNKGVISEARKYLVSFEGVHPALSLNCVGLHWVSMIAPEQLLCSVESLDKEWEQNTIIFIIYSYNWEETNLKPCLPSSPPRPLLVCRTTLHARRWSEARGWNLCPLSLLSSQSASSKHDIHNFLRPLSLHFVYLRIWLVLA